ncbi:hypothetical protein Nepgr_025535 [Nepenthes gracilis]|uniref:BHLH domain-containing protein n=1 Tax=Nepenthes gracilis TaxID=150966 RepID=A0AAD3T6P1_NEPGR|nr:hypothetical protein Nepgr_025535 [Nepenthes gracilis]
MPLFVEKNVESSGTVIDGGEWSSFNGVYANEEADFVAQLFPDCSLTNEIDGGSGLGEAPTCWENHESHFDMGGVDNSVYSSDSANSKLYYFSQESSFSGGTSMIYSAAGHENYYASDPCHFLAADNNSMCIDFRLADAKSTSFIQAFPDRMEGDDCLNQEMSSGNVGESEAELSDEQYSQPKRLAEMLEKDVAMEGKNSDSSENSKKRHCLSNVTKGKRNVKSIKYQKHSLGGNTDEDNHCVLNGKSSSSCSSVDNSHASQELNGGGTSSVSCKGTTALGLNGKIRASRGSATDPQSLYARKRRERINERLRILQRLVPNGTKVDISTMLEEAVQYVKFLQLQIKMLTSDDLWMYAPIAYNGMDIGLNLKIDTP